MGQLGRFLLIAGLVLAGLGLLLTVGDRFGLGRLPGDLVWKRKHTTIHFPIVTSIVLSVLLTLILNFVIRRK